MSEAFKIQPPERKELNRILTQMYGYFMVAQYRGAVEQTFPGLCIACKNEQVQYQLVAEGVPLEEPIGKLSWPCAKFGRVLSYKAKRGPITIALVALWNKK